MLSETSQAQKDKTAPTLTGAAFETLCGTVAENTTAGSAWERENGEAQEDRAQEERCIVSSGLLRDPKELNLKC